MSLLSNRTLKFLLFFAFLACMSENRVSIETEASDPEMVDFVEQTTNDSNLSEIVPSLNSKQNNKLSSCKGRDIIRMNIFVHGSYGFPVAFLTGSFCEYLVRKLYREKYKNVYNKSLMFNEGFYKISQLSSKVQKTDSDKYALYPIFDAFDKVSSNVGDKNIPGKKINDFYYLFGWSGMLSQKARIEASFCLYNAIAQEKKQLTRETKGFKNKQPKVIIRVFTHSHGGNVALNLAAIESLSKTKEAGIEKFDCFGLSKTGKRVKANFLNSYEKLASSEEEASKKAKFGMDKWLFKPKCLENPLIVDELFMLAAPVQSGNGIFGFF